MQKQLGGKDNSHMCLKNVQNQQLLLTNFSNTNHSNVPPPFI